MTVPTTPAPKRTLAVEAAMPRHGFSKSRLAKVLGISRVRLYLLLRQDAVIWATVERIAASLGVPPETLATRTIVFESKAGEQARGVWLDAG